MVLTYLHLRSYILNLMPYLGKVLQWCEKLPKDQLYWARENECELTLLGLSHPKGLELKILYSELQMSLLETVLVT